MCPSTAVFRELGCSVEWHLQEGSDVDPSSSAEGKVVVATVKGGARQVLLGERTALNILTRASGIATQVIGDWTAGAISSHGGLWLVDGQQHMDMAPPPTLCFTTPQSTVCVCLLGAGVGGGGESGGVARLRGGDAQDDARCGTD